MVRDTIMARSCHAHIPIERLLQALACATRFESRRLPNSQAIMNSRVNCMEPEQYPPISALVRNENPPYPRLTGTDYKKSIFKAESQECC